MPHWTMVSIEREKICKRRTHAALERTAIDLVTAELTDGIGSVLMSIHLDECKTAVRLEASLCDIAKVLEQRHEIVLSCVRSEVTDVASSLPLRSLLDDHLVRLRSLSWE